MIFPFVIKATRWWDYLNPFWWNRKRALEKLLAYTWERHDMQRKVNAAIVESMVYGKGSIFIDWEEK